MNDPDNVVDPVVLAERRARRAELAEEELRELLREAELGAATLKGRLAAVEGELATARAQRDALAADLARREKELIASNQREHAEQALRSEAQTRAAESETGTRRELDDLRVRLVAAERRAALLTEVEAEVAQRLERAKAAEDELAALRVELQSRQSEVGALRHELERYTEAALSTPALPESVDPRVAARIAAERTAFAAQIAAVEHTVAGLRPQLAAAASALADRLAAERTAREESERTLKEERARVTALQEQLEAATSRQAAILEVVAELQAAVDDLRRRFAGELDARVAELTGSADALRAELTQEQRLRSAAQEELERLRAGREEAAAELQREREQAASARAQFEHRLADHAALQQELERHAEQQAAVEEELERREAEHAALQDELERRIADHAAAVDELRREQGEHVAAHGETAAAARADLDRVRGELAAARSELERVRADHATGRDQVERTHALHEAVRAELERVQHEREAAHAELTRIEDEHAAARADFERRQADHMALQAELAREQAQHAAAQSELGREQALRASAEAELAAERERLEATAAELEALRAAPPPAPAVDISELTRAAERLREQAPAPEEHAEPEQPPAETAATTPLPAPVERRDELARILAEQQAAAAAAAAPDPYAHLPEFPVRAVVPLAAGDGAWLREAIRHVGRSDPALGAEVLLALAPVQSHAVRRAVAYQLTVGDVGTWRIALGDMEATIEPGASEAKVAFRLSGTPGELAAVLAGGGRRKLTGHVEGGRLALWRVMRARREPPTLAQAVAAGGDFSLRAVLALLAAAAPEGGRTVVAFDDADSPITAVATRRGAVVLRNGIEQPQATLHAPEQDLVALLVGLAPARPVRVSGDVTEASAFVTRLHRAQGLV